MTRKEATTIANTFVGALAQSGVGPKGRLWAFQMVTREHPGAVVTISKGGYRETQKARTVARNGIADQLMGKVI